MPQVEELEARYACLTFDNRGMGRSQPLGVPLSIEQMAEDTLALMDAVGWESAHLVGHSMGGLIALQAALMARQRVRSLSLLCTFARGADAARMTWPMFWTGLRTYVGTRRMRRRAFVSLVLPPSVLAASDVDAWAERLAPIFGHDLADQPPIVMKQLAAMKACDLTGRLGELAGTPTLVAGARHDLIARPEVVKRLADGLPGCRVAEFSEAAHGMTIQCAEKVNAMLGEWFEEAEREKVG
jgi:pimeloyl-ACP methyl ester carboxylesterase